MLMTAETKTPESFRHPRDPRVAIVTCRADFIRAARSDEFSAVIWKRNLPEKLMRCVAGVAAKMVAQTNTLGIKPFDFDLLNKEGLEDTEEYQHLLQTKLEIVDLQNAIRDANDVFDVMVGVDLSVPRHTHPGINHLNVIFGKVGTGWYNEQDEELFVDGGDYFFFKGDVEHFSAANDSDYPRITVVDEPH